MRSTRCVCAARNAFVRAVPHTPEALVHAAWTTVGERVGGQHARRWQGPVCCFPKGKWSSSFEREGIARVGYGCQRVDPRVYPCQGSYHPCMYQTWGTNTSGISKCCAKEKWQKRCSVIATFLRLFLGRTFTDAYLPCTVSSTGTRVCMGLVPLHRHGLAPVHSADVPDPCYAL